MNTVDLKQQFGNVFPWHYDPLKKDHNDVCSVEPMQFDFDGLCKYSYSLCEKQGDYRYNNKGWSYYLDDNLQLDESKFAHRDDQFQQLMNLWKQSNWTAENSCYWEFLDEELGDMYEPIRNMYAEKYPDVKHAQVRLIVKPPMTGLGLHSDTYGTFTRKHNVDKTKVFRIFTFCQDWDWGHYFLMGNETLSQYTAGTSYRVLPNVWHLSANVGFNPKVTLTYTGIKDD